MLRDARRVVRRAAGQRIWRLKEAVGHGGAAARSAAYILDELARRPVMVLRPHYAARRIPPRQRAAQPRTAAA